MILARVRGRLVSTIHHPVVDNQRLLVLDRLAPDGTPTGEDLIALDRAGAGAGETVLVLDEGNGARQLLDDPQAPVRSVVVGIVDAVITSGSDRERKPPARRTQRPSRGRGRR